MASLRLFLQWEGGASPRSSGTRVGGAADYAPPLAWLLRVSRVPAACLPAKLSVALRAFHVDQPTPLRLSRSICCLDRRRSRLTVACPRLPSVALPLAWRPGSRLGQRGENDSIFRPVIGYARRAGTRGRRSRAISQREGVCPPPPPPPGATGRIAGLEWSRSARTREAMARSL